MHTERSQKLTAFRHLNQYMEAYTKTIIHSRLQRSYIMVVNHLSQIREKFKESNEIGRIRPRETVIEIWELGMTK